MIVRPWNETVVCSNCGSNLTLFENDLLYEITDNRTKFYALCPVCNNHPRLYISEFIIPELIRKRIVSKC